MSEPSCCPFLVGAAAADLLRAVRYSSSTPVAGCAFALTPFLLSMVAR